MTLFEVAVLVVVLGVTVCAGAALAVLTFGVAAVRGLSARPADVTPGSYRERRRRPRRRKSDFPPDLAWPTYFSGQVGADLRRVHAGALRISLNMFRRWSDLFLRGRYGDIRRWWVILPLPVLSSLALLVSLLVVVVLDALFAVVVALYTAAALVLICLAVAIQRGAESLWIRLRGAEASCPHCYHVSVRPAYRCPGCSHLHRDVRPGRLGVFSRRCDCGTRLPTMVLRAAWTLTAVCQRCEEPLREGAAAVRDVRVPIFGDISAGKTRFLYAALDSLVVKGQGDGPPVSFPDAESRSQGERALAIVRSGQDTTKTSEALPRALSCRLGNGATGTLLHLFDAAGERYRTAAGHDDLGFLATGHGLVYVIDPFAIAQVRDRLTGRGNASADLARAGAGDPESAYGEVVSRLRGSGIQAQSQRLAVVVSRADLLEKYGVELPSASDELADWLYAAGLHNLVLAAKNEFAAVRYFAVASLASDTTGPGPDPGAPLRWLLRARGLKFPVRASELTYGGVRG